MKLPNRTHTKGKRGFQPSLEVLDNRWVPASLVNFDDGSLMITGDDADNVITVTAAADGTISVTADGVNSGPFANVEEISVRAAGGNDQVTVDLSALPTTPPTMDGDDDDDDDSDGVFIKMDGGAGDDALT